MKFAVIQPSGAVEIREGGEMPADAVQLSDPQYARAIVAETRAELDAILAEAAL